MRFFSFWVPSIAICLYAVALAWAHSRPAEIHRRAALVASASTTCAHDAIAVNLPHILRLCLRPDYASVRKRGQRVL